MAQARGAAQTFVDGLEFSKPALEAVSHAAIEGLCHRRPLRHAHSLDEAALRLVLAWAPLEAEALASWSDTELGDRDAVHQRIQVAVAAVAEARPHAWRISVEL